MLVSKSYIDNLNNLPNPKQLRQRIQAHASHSSHPDISNTISVGMLRESAVKRTQHPSALFHKFSTLLSHKLLTS